MSDAMDEKWGPQNYYYQAYDWTIYGVGVFHPPSPDVIAHEEIHFRQQDEYPGGVEAWWARYLEDAEFRLSMEVPAYLSHLYNGTRNLRSCLDALTLPLYGSPDRAEVHRRLAVGYAMTKGLYPRK